MYSQKALSSGTDVTTEQIEELISSLGDHIGPNDSVLVDPVLVWYVFTSQLMTNTTITARQLARVSGCNMSEAPATLRYFKQL